MEQTELKLKNFIIKLRKKISTTKSYQFNLDTIFNYKTDLKESIIMVNKDVEILKK